jgi:hypothetical protein
MNGLRTTPEDLVGGAGRGGGEAMDIAEVRHGVILRE